MHGSTVVTHVAFIPARSGSTRLSDKNMMDFCGTPLATLSVVQALAIESFDEVVFSTDSELYIDNLVSDLNLRGIDDSRLGIHRRSEVHSSATSKIFDVIRDLYGVERQSPNETDLVTLLLPTAPLRSRNTVERVVEAATQTGEDVFTCCKFDFHVNFAFSIESGRKGWTTLLSSNPMLTGITRSQDQKEYWHPHGGAVTLWTHRLTPDRVSLYSGAMPFETSRLEALDIDTFDDITLTRSVARALQSDAPFWNIP